MSLQYLIDGYNILNHSQFNRHLNTKIRNRHIFLLEFIWVKKLCGSPKNRIIVVFDGYPPASPLRQSHVNLDVIFAKNETADERIKRMVEKSGSPKNIVVVSDDKEIKFFVKSIGAQHMSVEEFIRGKETEGFLKRKDIAISDLKPELTYSQIREINQELKKIWL
jgi:predicted RNA-binding protein with PIN domain